MNVTAKKWGLTQTGDVFHIFNSDGTAMCYSYITAGPDFQRMGGYDEDFVNWICTNRPVRKCETCPRKDETDAETVTVNTTVDEAETREVPAVTIEDLDALYATGNGNEVDMTDEEQRAEAVKRFPRGTRVRWTSYGEVRMGTVNGLDVGSVTDPDHDNYGRVFVGVTSDKSAYSSGPIRVRKFVDLLTKV